MLMLLRPVYTQSMMAEDPTKRPTAEEVLKSAGVLVSKGGLQLSGARRSL